MSLLDRAANLATKAYNYIVGNDNVTNTASKKKTDNSKQPSANNTSKAANSDKKASINSVTNASGKVVGKIGETLEIKQTQKSNDNTIKVDTDNIKNTKHAFKTDEKSLAKSINRTKAKIQQKCQKFGISYQEVESTILAQMQFSYEEFKTLSQEEQLSILLSIDGALGLYIVDTKKKIHPTANKAAVIGQTAKNINEAKENGGIKNIDEFVKETGDINSELAGKINKNTTEEEYAKVLSESRRAFRASMKLKRLAEIKKCNGDQAKIDEVNRKYDARLHAYESQRQTDFAAANGAKKAHLSIYLRGGNDYAEAHETALNMYEGEEKTIVANSFTHEFEMEARRRYYEEGDPVSTEQYAKAVEQTTKYMSEDALNKFQNDAKEFREKVENGEIDAPYLTKEDFVKESAAISSGIIKNTKISEDTKQILISKWNNEVSGSKIYEKIITVIEPQIKNINSPAAKSVKTFYRDYSVRKLLEEVGGQKANQEQIERALALMSYEEAKKQFSKNSEKDFAKAVLHNPNLKGHLQNIVGYLKILPPEELNSIINGCSTDALLFVLRNVAPDKAGHLYDLSKGEMCYDARQLGEKIIEEGRQNAAA